MDAYLSELVRVHQNNFKIGLDVPLLGMKDIKEEILSSNSNVNENFALRCKNITEVDGLNLKDKDSLQQNASQLTSEKFNTCNSVNERHFVNRQPKQSKFFEKVESAGTEASYRCVRCRGCKDCKTGERIEFISIQDEVEEDVINCSFKVDLNKGYVIAKLPFICDPLKKLVSNEHMPKKSILRQIAKLNANKKDKERHFGRTKITRLRICRLPRKFGPNSKKGDY